MTLSDIKKANKKFRHEKKRLTVRGRLRRANDRIEVQARHARRSGNARSYEG